ncbi:MAG: hypothetical protein ABI456_16915 [Ktedonobacteraceae bacterium]|nr:hypothetical protein [Chloroflexota bacterium]
MSMSEFEEQHNTQYTGDPLFHLHAKDNQPLPADFSEEELLFAHELETLFSIDEERTPPYFVQTLLEPEDPRFVPVARGFEHKTNAAVFRRLKLKRRLFSVSRPSLRQFAQGVGKRRSLLTLVAGLLIFMLVTVVFTAPSFASGVQLLLGNTRTGVYQVRGNLHTSRLSQAAPVLADIDSRPASIGLLSVQQQLHFPLYWPQTSPANYTLNQVYINQAPGQRWADGPVVELQYTYTGPGALIQGQTAQLAIREFKPRGDVYQVVESGAARGIGTDQNDHAQAIYIHGQWGILNKYSRRWLFNQHSELMFQRDGVVFWIAGDLHEGMDMAALLNVANSLEVLDVSRVMHEGVTMNYVAQVEQDVPGPFDSDILLISPDNGSGGPYLWLGGPSNTSPDKPVQKTAPHIHTHGH